MYDESVTITLYLSGFNRCFQPLMVAVVIYLSVYPSTGNGFMLFWCKYRFKRIIVLYVGSRSETLLPTYSANAKSSVCGLVL